MHRFLCVTADTKSFMILSPVIMFLRVHMVSVKVFVVGGVIEINPTFFVFARPAMFRSVAGTGFSKADAILVERRRIVGMKWQGSNVIFRVGCKVFIKREGSVNLLVTPATP